MFKKSKKAEGSEAPAAPSKKTSKRSGAPFDAQKFLLYHVEKFVFAMIAGIALFLVYLGFNAKHYPKEKTPDSLAKQANEVLNQVKNDNHWKEMAAEAGRNVKADFEAKAKESQTPVVAGPYATDILNLKESKAGNKRGDAPINAPIELEGKYFVGSVATFRASDPMASLENAKPKEEDRPANRTPPRNGPGGGPGGPGGPGGRGGSPPGGYNSGSSGPPGGYGGGSGSFGGGGPGGISATGTRHLAPGYDQGYRPGMKTAADLVPPPKAADKVEAASAGQFVVVTALAPHKVMEDAYKKEYSDVPDYMPGRDTPNYMGFEVQRVDVTDNPSKELKEEDWQPLPDSSSEKYKEWAKKTLVGTCNEVHPTDWVASNISMPIPPILIQNYREYAKHSKIESLTAATTNAAGSLPGSNSSGGNQDGDGGDSGGMMGGFGGPGGPGGYGGGGPPGGYSGGSNGPPGGYSGGGGGPPGGYSGGGGGPPSGYGSSGGPGGPGGRGPGGPGGGFGGNTTTSVEAPKALPVTEYKLVRFYDFKASPNKVYRYRVRLKMYDSNLPEAIAITPKTSTLKQDALRRVQTALSKEKSDAETRTDTKTVMTRSSGRMTDWSNPSAPIVTVAPTNVYLEEANITYSGGAEATPPTAEAVYAEWDRGLATFVPRKDKVWRGSVFGTVKREKDGKEAPIEVIHPVTKIIKALLKNRSSNLVTVIDIRGMESLRAVNVSRDPLKTGGEMIAYDSGTGQIVVSREFEDFTDYNMYAQPDHTAVGPLGGGLRLSSGMGGGPGGPGGGPGGRGGPGGGPGGGPSGGGGVGGAGSGSPGSD